MVKDSSKNINGITFKIDGKLPEQELRETPRSAQSVIANIMESENQITDTYLTSSFESEELYSFGSDSFFQTVLGAFRLHKSLVLSPDMIWLKILQTFSRHVNDNAERYCHLTSVEAGKKALVFRTTMDIFAENVDWALIMDEFEEMIAHNVQNEFTRNLVSDYSTTGLNERVASQITVMDAMKPYFEYIAHRYVCGIPSITLIGESDDWKRIIQKLDSLKAYDGLRDWIEGLIPILQEFVNTSEGNVDRRFWRDIVMKRHPSQLHVGGCVPKKNPSITGWILKFYPFDYKADLLNRFAPTWHMKSEMVSVPWKYIVDDGVKEEVYSMEFWAGFVGTKYDEESDSFTPRIGWFVRKADSDKEIATKWEEDYHRSRMELRLHGPFPTFLAEIKKFENLSLDFDDEFVELPDWMDALEIECLTVSGRYHRGDKTKFRARFPKIRFY